MKLGNNLKEALLQKDILIMSHAVMGFPSFESNHALVALLAEEGIELIELQFPFTDPISDGPYFLKANQESVRNATTVAQCFDFVREASEKHPKVSFVVTTYLNIVIQYGIENFITTAADSGAAGVIIPDWPIEEWQPYRGQFEEADLSMIHLVTRRTNEARLDLIAEASPDLLYCSPRLGVTGFQSVFDADCLKFLESVQKASKGPVGVGFGLKTGEDVAALTGLVDVAIVCTEVVKCYVENGEQATRDFVRQLRP